MLVTYYVIPTLQTYEIGLDNQFLCKYYISAETLDSIKKVDRVL